MHCRSRAASPARSPTKYRVELPQIDGQNVGSVDRDHGCLQVESGIVTLPADPRHAWILSAEDDSKEELLMSRKLLAV